ncbi:hypothetical protein [Aeromonas veronii]|uniref:hypothetical protein n=1 Tax=Aeromonas veronii TaxID=654 RepID=UPI001CC2C4A5|nr:hypothetical protein [Aeromonas veronii]
MTATHLCNSAPMPAVRSTMQVSHGMTMFLAEELLPLMAGLWPASANQLDGNVRGVAMAWGLQLSGFTADQITDAVMELASDTGRQFAPRPAEVKAAITASLAAAQPVAPNGQTISIRACEMIAEVRVLKREGAAPAEQVAAELASLQASLRQRGVTVTGRI